MSRCVDVSACRYVGVSVCVSSVEQVPTQLGIVLVHGYYKIDEELVLPTVRSAIEEQCTLIANGDAKIDDVLEHSLNIFEAKFRHFVDTITSMDELFEASFSPIAGSGKPIGRCGRCRRYMNLIMSVPSRIHCPTCNVTYKLPQNGTIKNYMSKTCPLDGFELVVFSLGNSAQAQGKSFPLCPYCFNNVRPQRVACGRRVEGFNTNGINSRL